MAGAVARGRLEEITSMGGSYWMVVHDAVRRRTVVAGDLAEQRGVFTAATGRGPVWATDAALLAAQLGRGPDLELLAARITVGTAEHWPRRSVWTSIERVPGGHALVLEDGAARTVDVRPRPDDRTLEEGAGEVGAALWAASQGYARAAGPRVGADLSGGLDSSTVVIAAAEVCEILAVTYGGPLADGEDTQVARRVAEYVGAEHHVSSGGSTTAHFSRWPQSVPALAGPAGVVVPAGCRLPATSAWGICPSPDRPRRRCGAGIVDGRVGRAHPGRADTTGEGSRDRPGPPGQHSAWPTVAGSEGRRTRTPACPLPAAEAVGAGHLLGDGLRAWTWCQIGAAAQWLTAHGRQTVSAMLDESGQAAGDVNAGEWDDWAALRYNGSAMRDSMPLFAKHGVNEVSPFLDNEVVRACPRIRAGKQRRPGIYKPLLALARPDLPAWLTGRQSKGHFTPLLYAGLRSSLPELHQVIDTSALVEYGMLDPAAVHTALDAAAAGIGRPPLPALENFLVSSWWLAHMMAPLTAAGGAR
ncbi:asparagine synthase-related protein [Streptomyces sp. NPDC002514]|uniref:asparagine synthase-related protein n=1 Tax=Streptomyces sp. NPDC001270 TaxID=3364554 RepID=UPI00368E0DF9